MVRELDFSHFRDDFWHQLFNFIIQGCFRLTIPEIKVMVSRLIVNLFLFNNLEENSGVRI